MAGPRHRVFALVSVFQLLPLIALGTSVGVEQDGKYALLRVAWRQDFSSDKVNNDVVTARLEGKSAKVSEDFAQDLCRLGSLREFNVIQQEDYESAYSYYRRCQALDPENVDALVGSGWALFNLHRYTEAVGFLEEAIKREKSSSIFHKLALAYHYSLRYVEAEAAYKSSILLGGDAYNLYFDYGVTLQRLGKIQEAADAYNGALAKNISAAEAWLNIGMLHQKYGRTEDGIRCYEKVLSIPKAKPSSVYMATLNLAIAREFTGKAGLALEMYVRLLQDNSARDPSVAVTMESIMLLTHISRVKRPICQWDEYEESVEQLWNLVRSEQLERGIASSLQPFDGLLLPLNPRWQRWIAASISSQWVQQTYKDNPVAETRKTGGSPLRLGYLSYDFSDHPTSHLVVGLFRAHNRTRVHVAAYAYGKDDNGTYRHMVRSLADEFINVVRDGNVEVARRLEADQVDVLLDLQAHTLGSRPEIVALHPAPIVVNYLAYPGTMGADCVDFIITDKFVSPPENARISATLLLTSNSHGSNCLSCRYIIMGSFDTIEDHFSEKLVVHPHCYQVNDYEGLKVEKIENFRQRRLEQGLPAEAFVFANFNKLDKLDPESFSVWMAILRQVPNSVLWLLRPKEDEVFGLLRSNLQAEMAAAGVNPERLVFASRLSKDQHLARHQLADLFLDNFIYGAHSTATDALRGGLPVITLAGENFASRVAGSLLHNLGLLELVCFSKREFEHLGVSLAKNPTLLGQLRRKLLENTDTYPLFDTSGYTEVLERSFQAMMDLRALGNLRRHLLIGSKSHTPSSI